MKRLIGASLVALIVAGCSSAGGNNVTGDTSPVTPAAASTKPAAETPAADVKSTAPRKAKSGIDASAMEKAFVTALGGEPIKSLCDAAYTHWSCFYDGVQAGPSYLRINLTTDGGADEGGLAKSAGNNWFTMIGCQYPDLNTIVVKVNGVDHNVFRKDTKANLIKC